MIRASNIRLPGVYFLPSPRPRGSGLPPLDVAAFVGFAERGPLDWPVGVEDLDTYRAIFGGDLALARESGGRTVYANLPTAVASFFAQGGRRCYVVRVAGREATRTLFRLGGLVSVEGAHESGSAEAPRLATVHASSEGRWSETLRLGARLRSTPLPLNAFEVLAPETFEVEGEEQVTSQLIAWTTGSAPEAIQAGDLLRLTYDGGRQYLFPVEEVRRPLTTSTNSSPPAPAVLATRRAWEMLPHPEANTTRVIDTVDRLTANGLEPLNVGGRFVTFEGGGPGGDDRSKKGFFFTKITGPDAALIAPGDVLQIRRLDKVTVLFPVEETATTAAENEAPMPFARAAAVLRLPAQVVPQPAPLELLAVERLRFDLLLRAGNDRRPTIAELSFNAPHARFWGDAVLLESSGLRRHAEGGDLTRASNARPAVAAGREPEQSHAAVSADIFKAMRGDARIDGVRLARLDSAALGGLLAPVEEEGRTYLPLGMLSILDEADIRGPREEDLGEDGLGVYDPRLFVDESLVDLDNQRAPDALMAEAFDRYYIQDKRLRGLHSLTFTGEAALVALPEAVQREWPGEVAPDDAPPAEPPPAPESPDLSKFLCCHAHDAAATSPPVSPSPSPSSPFITSPSGSPPASSNVNLPPLPVLKEINTDDADDPQYAAELRNLISLHRALLTFCQARRDAFGVLALPPYFEKRHCVKWLESFRADLGLPARRTVFADARDVADLSYVAVYHPWLLIPDQTAADRLRAVPPDGAACGMIAARERLREAWVAPAGVALSGVLDLSPSISTSDWADLFDLQFNLVRREPRDFRAMSAHTLSDESIWLQISVRRLLILIRKFVVERGMDFVFESNHERFRQGVRLVLEDALRFMYERGAFAGAAPEEAFVVTTDASVNPPASVDAGRFVAQIQVAPSQPLEFITVLLTRVGEDLLQAREA